MTTTASSASPDPPMTDPPDQGRDGIAQLMQGMAASTAADRADAKQAREEIAALIWAAVGARQSHCPDAQVSRIRELADRHGMSGVFHAVHVLGEAVSGAIRLKAGPGTTFLLDVSTAPRLTENPLMLAEAQRLTVEVLAGLIGQDPERHAQAMTALHPRTATQMLVYLVDYVANLITVMSVLSSNAFYHHDELSPPPGDDDDRDRS